MSNVVPETNGDRGDAPRRRILVVDDDDGLRAGLAIGLKRDGYMVQLASDAHEATEKLASMDFDLILLDLHLPGTINGLSLLNTIRAERSPLHLPVIIISGSSDSANIVTALRDGANDYVVKPFRRRHGGAPASAHRSRSRR